MNFLKKVVKNAETAVPKLGNITKKFTQSFCDETNTVTGGVSLNELFGGKFEFS